MKRIWHLAGLCLLATIAAARPFTVVVYNVENLVDLDGVAGFEDYQPDRYSRAHAATKLRNIGRVVARFDGGRGPDILILCEIEVDRTPAARPANPEAQLARFADMTLADMLGPRFNPEIADLPAEVLLAKSLAEHGINGYRIVAGENVTAPGTTRGIEHKNVVFTRFPVKSVRSHPTTDARPILEVELDIDGAALHVFANHWKSAQAIRKRS